jgi:putative aldouronate transport system permease protein
VIHVDLPTIMPTICMMLILRFGSIMEVGYEKTYLMQYTTNLEKSEVISTYVFKNGISSAQYSYGTAVDLMNSAITICLVLLVNWITNKLSDGENGLF